MKRKVRPEEEVEFWQSYISNWEARHNMPAPERAHLLLENALLKLERYRLGKSLQKLLQMNSHTLH